MMWIETRHWRHTKDMSIEMHMQSTGKQESTAAATAIVG